MVGDFIFKVLIIYNSLSAQLKHLFTISATKLLIFNAQKEFIKEINGKKIYRGKFFLARFYFQSRKLITTMI